MDANRHPFPPAQRIASQPVGQPPPQADTARPANSPDPSSAPPQARASPQQPAPQTATAPLIKPKIADRAGQPSSTTGQPVAQRVVLYDEDPSDPKGKQYVGSVVWRTEPIKACGSEEANVAVRADIDIPDRKFKMTMSFGRNTDPSLPASHTAELTFVLPRDFSGGGIANVPSILMKSNEQARASPLAGLGRSPTAPSSSACPTWTPIVPVTSNS